MKIIDFHTHLFPEKVAAKAISKLSNSSHAKAFSDGTARGLLSNMERAGINTSVILPVATNVSQVKKVNDSSADINERYGDDGIISFGCIHPDFEDYRAELGRFSSLGLKGVKLHPVFVDVALDDIRYLRIIDRAAELGLMVVTHLGYDIGFPGVDLCNPKMARHVIDKIGDFDFILAHMGGWHMWDDAITYLSDTSCYIDTSFSTGRIVPAGAGDAAVLGTDAGAGRGDGGVGGEAGGVGGVGGNVSSAGDTVDSMSAAVNNPVAPEQNYAQDYNRDYNWEYEQDYEREYALPANVQDCSLPAFDMQLLDEEHFMNMMQKFGSERIVFGTDSPWTEANNSIDFIKNLPLSDADKENIFYRNASRLLEKH